MKYVVFAVILGVFALVVYQLITDIVNSRKLKSSKTSSEPSQPVELTVISEPSIKEDAPITYEFETSADFAAETAVTVPEPTPVKVEAKKAVKKKTVSKKAKGE